MLEGEEYSSAVQNRCVNKCLTLTSLHFLFLGRTEPEFRTLNSVTHKVNESQQSTHWIETPSIHHCCNSNIVPSKNIYLRGAFNTGQQFRLSKTMSDH